MEARLQLLTRQEPWPAAIGAAPIPQATPRPAPQPALQAAERHWATTPRIAAMFAMLRDLNALHTRIAAHCHSDPAAGLDGVRGEVGAVTGLYENDYSGPARAVWTVRANGGAAASLWELLTEQRDAWIDAQLVAEGFPPWTWSDEKHDRRDALAEQAGTVAMAWAGFCEAVHGPDDVPSLQSLTI